jgi:hypothetical protein
VFSVLDPVGRTTVARTPRAKRLHTLHGIKLGVLANGKPNAANLLRIAHHRLERDCGVAEVLFVSKLDSGRFSDAAPDWMLTQLAECDAVIHGSGD